MSHKLPLRSIYLLSAAALLGASGCGGNVPVSGKVQWEEGGPVAGVSVRFVPVSGTQEADGFTDKDGEFTLTSAGNPGAPAGDYKVCVTKAAGTKFGGTEPGKNPEDMMKAMKGDGSVGTVKAPAVTDPVPVSYSDPKTTTLNFKVEAGKKAEFKISKKG